MKVFSSLLVLASLFAPSFQQAVGTGHTGPGNPNSCSGRLMEFHVTINADLVGDITFALTDKCVFEVVGTLQYAARGNHIYTYCLDPLRHYGFQITDFPGNVDVNNDHWSLMWGTSMVVENGVITPNTQNATVFGPPCDSGPDVTGDPHFKTLSGNQFDFHGACDLLMMSAPSFSDGLGLDVHVRTKSRYQYSFVETAAIKIGDDILEVGSYGQTFFNGVEGPSFPLMMGGLFPVEAVRSDKKNHVFEIDLGNDEKIRVKSFKDLVSVLVPEKVSVWGEGYYGMWGHPKINGDMMDRSGNKLILDPIEYGMEWQVRDTDPKLFQNKNNFPQYPAKCVMPTVSTEERRRLGALVISEEQAKRACEVAGRQQDLDNCIYDVVATGDLESAQAGVF